MEANSPCGHGYPVTTMAELDIRDLKAPIITKKRGRPRKTRFESQEATAALEIQIATRRCGACRIPGHNRRSCPNLAP